MQLRLPACKTAGLRIKLEELKAECKEAEANVAVRTSDNAALG